MNPIEEIKSRLDIVEVIGESVQLRKSGRAYTGFCPFHPNTRTPAFTVYPDTQSFYCFGCQASGSVFDFVMRRQGLDFREALKQLALRAGVDLKPRSSEEEQRDQQRTRMLEINTIAARYFNYILMQHRGGKPGRLYVQRRDITTETVEAFSLGYSLPGGSHLLTYLTQKKGYSPDEVVAAGLAVEKDERVYDRFRGRLIFTIRNARGEVVGFGGRAIGDAQPKYLNTPQTLLFDKSRTLYGLDLARDAIRSADATVVVEGYVDVLTAHQHGFRNVVAPLGTALTSNHARLLRKLSHHVYFALDADAAGQRATLRGISALQRVGEDEQAQPEITAQGLVRWSNDLVLKIITMPAGHDPDEIIKENPQRWRDLIDSALPVMDFYIQAYTSDLDLSQPQEQRTALDRLLPLIRQLDATQRRIYVSHLEHLVGIRAELIVDLLHNRSQGAQPDGRRQHAAPGTRAAAGGYGRPAAPQHHTSAPQHPTEIPENRLRLAQREDFLLSLMMRYPGVCVVVEEQLASTAEATTEVNELLGTTIESLFERTENRLVWQAWEQATQRTATPPLTGEDDRLPPWVEHLDETLHAHARHLLRIPHYQEYRYHQDAHQCVKHIRMQQARRWKMHLNQQLQHGDEGESERIAALLDQLSLYLSPINAPPQNNIYDADVRWRLLDRKDVNSEEWS